MTTAASDCRSAGTASGPGSRACPPCSASTPPRCWPSWASTKPPSRTWETAMSSSYSALTVTRSADGFVVTVELHRPEALNAMNTAMGEDLLRCFDAFTWDTTARAVVFTGAGDKAFCVGGDLKERMGMTDEAWRAQHLIFEQAAARV